MEQTVQEILAIYDDKAALADAHTIPAPWYFDERIAELEREIAYRKRAESDIDHSPSRKTLWSITPGRHG